VDEDVHLPLGEGLLGRHPEIGIRTLDVDDEERLLEISRNDRGPGMAALLGERAGIQAQASLGLGGLGAMALVASGREERKDLGLVVLDRFRVGLLGRPRRPRERGEEENPADLAQSDPRAMTRSPLIRAMRD
jgi:hypothetical protein